MYHIRPFGGNPKLHIHLVPICSYKQYYDLYLHNELSFIRFQFISVVKEGTPSVSAAFQGALHLR